MKSAKRFLIVINRTDDARFVLEKAAKLAAAEKAAVQVVRIIFDHLVDLRHMDPDEAQALKVYIMQSEEEFLVDLIDDYRNRFSDIEALTLWNKRVSEGTIHAAEQFEADLIIKAVDASSPVFPRHPDDWNLLRHAGIPVFVLSSSPWEDNPPILAAANLLDDEHDDLNRSILETGEHLATELGGTLSVVCAYPGIKSWSTADTNLGVDYLRLQSDITSIAQQKLATLSDGRVDGADLFLHEGTPVDVVETVIEQTKAEITVIGNAAREGLRGFVIGNTAEALLGAVHTDLLVLTAPDES